MSALKLELPAHPGCVGKAFRGAVGSPLGGHLRGWILPSLERDMGDASSTQGASEPLETTTSSSGLPASPPPGLLAS